MVSLWDRLHDNDSHDETMKIASLWDRRHNSDNHDELRHVLLEEHGRDEEMVLEYISQEVGSIGEVSLGTC